MEMGKVAVLGAGNGGYAAAGDLASRGYDVTLFEQDCFKENIEPVMRDGEITVRWGNDGESKVRVKATTDPREALWDAEFVVVTVPSFAIEQLADVVAPWLSDGQLVLINGSSAMNSLRFRRRLAASGNRGQVMVGETASLTYGCRRHEGSIVDIFLQVKKVLFSAFPACDTTRMLERCRPLYPCLRGASNILETTLNNGNPESHPAPTLMSLSRIERSGRDFSLYSDGITPAVVNAIRAICEERLRIGRALGFDLMSTQERLFELGYINGEGDLAYQYNTSKVFSRIKGPSSLDCRYLTEDIPYGLTLWASIGDRLSVPTPTIKAVITLASAALRRDFWAEGLNLSKLGLGEMAIESMLRYLDTGEGEREL